MKDRFGVTLCVAAALTATGCLPHPSTPLAVAARGGDVTETRRLLESGVPADAADSEGWTPLLWAARAGAAGTMAALIDAGADVDRRDGWIHGWTPVLHAIHKGQVDAVRLLLDRGASVDVRSRDGLAPIVAAAGGCDCDRGRGDSDMDAIFFLLLERGADVRAEGDVGARALTNAVAGGRTAVVHALLDRVPDLRLRAGLDGEISLLLSKLRGKTEIVSRVQRPAGGR